MSAHDCSRPPARSSPITRASSPRTSPPARSRSASTRSGSRTPRRTAGPTGTCSSRRRLRGVHRRRHPLRRDDPPERRRRHAVRRAARVEGRRSRDQGRHRRQAARAARRARSSLRARRAARALRGVRRPRRALRQVARGDHDRRRHPDARLHSRERARARPLRGDLPGGRARADRRARGADGCRQHDRGLLRRDARTLQATYEELYEQGVDLEGTLLKPNMVISGKGCPEQAPASRSPSSRSTSSAAIVPAAVPGIVFLSGGQSEVEATENLDAINRIEGSPWPLSFSYGRALQASALEAWRGSRRTSRRARLRSSIARA